MRNAVLQSVRSAFEYQGQKCSALSRLYVPESLWTPQGGFKDQLLSDVAKIKVGPQTEWSTFVGPVIGRAAYDRILGYISKAKDRGGEVLIGGTGDDSTGYFIQPTVILTKDPQSVTMTDEIFGPVLTVYVYPDEEFERTVDLIDCTGQYALTGSMYVFIFLSGPRDSVYLTYAPPLTQFLNGPPRPAERVCPPPSCSWQHLLQRQVHRRRCWPTAVWRRPWEWDQR